MSTTFGERLKNLRIEKNYSQNHLASKLFVSRSSVANWETGRRIPDFIIISRIAQLFNVDVSDLTDNCPPDSAPAEVIIVDDETILLQGAISILSNVMPNAVITGFPKASEAIDYAKNNRISIAFLDIEIGKSSGIDLCNRLMDINPLTNVIFLTSYPDYAIKAWDTAASGFLVKPLHESDVRTQLDKMRFPVKGL